MEPSKLKIERYSHKTDAHAANREKIAGWIYNEFIHGIRPGISYGDVLGRFADAAPGGLPVRYAAFFGGECVGTVSLVANDLACREYTPWLSSLYVAPEFRGRGVGRALISEVKTAARELGHGRLYLRTEFAGGYYRKLGWSYIEQCADEFGLTPEVFIAEL